MTTTADRVRPAPDRGGGSQSGVLSGWAASMRATLDKPLTSYYLLMLSAGLLLVIGLMMVLSASSVYSFRHHGHNSYAVFMQQLISVAIALPLAYVASKMPRKLIRVLAWPALVGAIVLLGLVQTGLGQEVNGNQNWIRIGPMQLQPSEIAKLAVILWCADVLARKERLITRWGHAIFPVVPVMGGVVGLVLMGHDLGTALVLLGILLGLLWVSGAPMKLFGLAGVVIGFFAFYMAVTDKERLTRLTTFTDPFKHFGDDGWQAAHGIMAMSSGGIFGRGIGASQQKWGGLPEAHTDFIFAVLGEELGLAGTLLVLGLFLTLAYAGFRVATRSEDAFTRLLAAGITVWLTVQMLVNVGMVLALLPVIGIPLPLVSYGGSALLPSLVALGLLVSFARNEPGARAALEARRRRRPAGVTASSRRAR